MEISIILVNPQMPENIGGAARAMLNFGLTDLRVVNPRDKFPCEKSIAIATHAHEVVKNAGIYNSLSDASHDLQQLFATTARKRDMVKQVVTPKTLPKYATQQKIGIVFGGENSGLTNADVSLCDYILNIPANTQYNSINLAQAVLLIGYELWNSKLSGTRPQRQAASKDELSNFFIKLEQRLDDANFFQTPDKKPKMLDNIRNIFSRGQLTSQEIRTLHGIMSALDK